MSAKKLGFGLMRLPLTDPAKEDSIDIDLTCRMVDRFLERGFTYFDTAWMYCGGKSEEAVKTVLVDRHPRDSFTLTTKLPAYMLKSFEDRDKVFNEQLRRTGAGYFDYYWLHDVNSKSIETFEKYDCFSYILDKKEKGLVKHVGFSYHDGPELLDRILREHPEMEYVQLQINYLDWNSAGIQSRKCYEVAAKHGKPVIVMEPVKGGTLAKLPEKAEAILRSMDASVSLPSWAIRFAATPENIFMVLSGMSTMEQLEDNTGFMSDFVPLNKAETENVLKCADIINSDTVIPCTGCSYCTVGCPMNIPIPKYFSLYNTDIKDSKGKDWTPQQSYYENYCLSFGKASDCAKCGQCENMCPQHIPIRMFLDDVAEYFEKK